MKNPPFTRKETGKLTILKNTHVVDGVATNTNLEVFVSYSVDYTGPAVLVPHSIIKSALKSNKGAYLSGDGNAMLAGGLTIPFKAPPVRDFPDIPTIDGDAFEIPGFADAVRACTYAAADQDVRYFLNGVCLQIEKDQVVVVATDGHRLHRVILDAVPGMPIGEHIFPRACLRFIDSDTVRIAKDGIRAQVGEHLNTIMVDGKFPDWRRIMPKHKNKMTCDRDELLSALKQIEPFTNPKYQGVKFELANGKLLLTATSPGNEPVTIDVAATYGSELTQGFVCSYLTQALASCDAVAVMYYGKENEIVRFEGNGIAVVMPMRL